MKALSKRIWLAALLCALVTGCSSDPEYQGIPLSKWQKGLTSTDVTIRTDAVKAIASMGPTAFSAEMPLRSIARNDPVPAVRVAAIYALDSLGFSTGEFEDFLKEVTAPLVVTEDEDKNVTSADADSPDSLLQSTAGDDDINYLQELSLQSDSTAQDSNQSVVAQISSLEENERNQWIDDHRSEVLSNIVQYMKNPDVMAYLLNTGTAQQRRLIGRLLQNQDGGVSPRLFSALQRAAADTDSVLTAISREALKKWVAQ